MTLFPGYAPLQVETIQHKWEFWEVRQLILACYVITGQVDISQEVETTVRQANIPALLIESFTFELLSWFELVANMATHGSSTCFLIQQVQEATDAS